MWGKTLGRRTKSASSAEEMAGIRVHPLDPEIEVVHGPIAEPVMGIMARPSNTHEMPIEQRPVSPNSDLNAKMAVIVSLTETIKEAVIDSKKDHPLNGDALNEAIKGMFEKYMPQNIVVGARGAGALPPKDSDYRPYAGEVFPDHGLDGEVEQPQPWWDEGDVGQHQDSSSAWLGQRYSGDKTPMVVVRHVNTLPTSGRKYDIKPPQGLKSSTAPINLNRMQALTRVFGPIPVFSNSDQFTVRELLEGLNAQVRRLGGSISLQEYEIILDSKLSPRVKSCLAAYHSESLSAIYSNLLNLFSAEASKREAFAQIVKQGKSKFTTLRAFTEETMRLLSLTQENEEQKSKYFIYALGEFLPPRLAEKVMDMVKANESLYNGKPPSLQRTLDLIFDHKEEIDQYLAKSKEKVRYNVVEVQETVTNTGNEKTCSVCSKVGHTSETCYRNEVCKKCDTRGHISRWCRNPKRDLCHRCDEVGHTSKTCNKGKPCRLCNDMAHSAVMCGTYPGVEPCRAPCSMCQNRLFIKLFHPERLCVVFGPQAKN